MPQAGKVVGCRPKTAPGFLSVMNYVEVAAEDIQIDDLIRVRLGKDRG